MPKVLIKIENVYFASRWFNNKFGDIKEGEVTLSDSKLLARRYDADDSRKVIRDARLLGISISDIEVVKVG